MKEKVWKDCPSCGSRDSMQYKKKQKFTAKVHGSDETVNVTDLDGYFCSVCGEGIYTRQSQAKINEEVARVKAIIASKEVTVSEVIKVEELTGLLKTTRQNIHSMMKTGKLPYVIVSGEMKPYRATLTKARELVKKSKVRSLISH
ncbi:type II toxin-antitoxin system MqsA family antitoxin [Leptospira licerasiae]|uniref:type II toxin-antitoxin system MqsA family antitoxin n=1 Tax=Leptospira licerasiae TaxID=447106 RepID=UPI001082AECE|nr:type II toxin-antitoxin system MqsA family antitoxin [Leptospira licerasiae]TGM87894.1 YgiT-type zinc finger protein [Leptospira licerasiae]